jgi:dephospho-CoA kinase
VIRVGLTGGMACGKSFVARTLEGLGCRVIRADDLGHSVLEKGGEAYQPVIDLLGPGILDPSGTIDRKRVAAEVFHSPERLAELNAIVHPAVIRMQEDFFRQVALADPAGIAVVEAAILIETGSHRRFDKLIVVVCTPEQQVQRAIERQGYTLEEARARLSRQMPVEEKRRFADYVIDTSGAKEQTVAQTTAVYELLRSLEK